MRSRSENMNFTLIKIGPSDDEDHTVHKRNLSHYVKTDAFTVLPPLSPQIPGPPRTPDPYRILPPIVSRKRPSFVIIQEVGSKPPSRETSPSGRVSPFRGCGFRSSREASPTRNEKKEKHQSRSRLPVAQNCARKVSKSVSPVGTKTSGIPRPLNRRISYSPNRAKEVLQELDSKVNHQKPPLRSSENLQRTSIRQQKPPLPHKPKVKNLNLQKSPDKKPIAVTSPLKAKPPFKPVASPTKKPTLPSRNVAKSPEKNKSFLAKSKENLVPSKIPSPLRSPSKMVKSTPPTSFKSKNERKSPATNNESKSLRKLETSEMISAELEPSGGKESKKEAEEKSPTSRIMKKKAQTTNILINATRKHTKKEQNLQKDSKNNSSPVEEEKKDLPHTDTSKSLPISVDGSNMTETSATLIRTTTEPALAPLEPELITEIRTAMNDLKNEEEICIKQEKNNLYAVGVSTANSNTDMREENSTGRKPKSVSEKIEESMIMSERVKETLKKETELKNSKNIERNSDLNDSPKLPKDIILKNNSKVIKDIEIHNSPLPVHIVAVTKIDGPKQEITAIGSIKQDPDKEVSSASDSIKSDNRNGMSKSSWLQKKPNPEAMKKPILQKSVRKEHPSKENLIEKMKPLSRWKRLKSKCPACFKKSEKTVQISTITKSAATTHNTSQHSCFKKYFCYFCYKCKLKKGNKQSIKIQKVTTKTGGKRFSLKCINCKNSFKNIFNKVSCKKNRKKVELPKSEKLSEKSDSGVACVNVSQERSCCVKCTSGLYKCFGILCCLNTAFCLKMNKCCKNVCFCRSVCCGSRQKKNITEPSRRKSTISTPKKRRWTKMFSDFPKLDAGFVEHASLMRGSIPVLPVPLAWFCLILNVFLPGFGTLSSGIFCLFVGKPRFSINDSIVSRIGAFLVNLLVAGSQLFTVLFCLVGWGWSVWWGVMMLKMAKKNKRIMLAERAVHAAHVTPVEDKNRDVEKTGSNG